MQAHFSRHVQELADELGRELVAGDIWDVFQRVYHVNDPSTSNCWIMRKRAGRTARASSRARSAWAARNSRFPGAATG
jgi:hypothetical protein